jgi:hypothetical protein
MDRPRDDLVPIPMPGRLARLERLLRRTRDAIRDVWIQEKVLRRQVRSLRDAGNDDPAAIDESCAPADGAPPWALAELARVPGEPGRRH